MLFTLSAQKNILEDQIHHAEIDHPEYTPEQLAAYVSDKRRSLEALDRTIGKVKQVVESSIC